MSIPINENGAKILADALLSRLKSTHAAVVKANTENQSDIYNTIINIPSHNKSLQDAISDIQNSGQISRVMAQLNESLPSDVVLSDVQNFANAVDLISSDIEINASLFLLSINPTTKRGEFVTPVAQNIKDAIAVRITAVLAEVS